MPYSVWPSAATRASPAGTSVVKQPGAGALALAGQSLSVINSGSTSFSTSFGSAETTISEGGAWARLTGPQPDSGSDHSGWHDVSTTGGNAVPRFNAGPTSGLPGGDYDDAYSLLTGTWPADMEATAQIYVGASGAQEIELLFRGADTAGSPGTVALYECLFNPNGLYEAVRWNGPSDDFTSLAFVSDTTLVDGDWIKASVTGTGATVTITMWYARAASPTTWVQLLSTADTSGSRRTSGRPGIGFFSRSPETLNYGLRSYSVIGV